MTEFSAEQLPSIAKRIMAERDAGREADPYRIAWAKDILAFFDCGDRVAGRRVFIEDEPEDYSGEEPLRDDRYADCAAADWWAARTGA